MKNIFKVLGIIVIAAAAGFSMAACNLNDDDGDIETIIGTFEFNESTNEITFSFPDDEMDGLTATFNGENAIIISGILDDGGEFLNGTYTRSGSGNGLIGTFKRTVKGEFIITFTFKSDGTVITTIQDLSGGSNSDGNGNGKNSSTLTEHRGTWTKDGAFLTIEATQFTVSGNNYMVGTYKILHFSNNGNGKWQYNFLPGGGYTSEWAIECQLVNGNLVLANSGPSSWHGIWIKD